MIKAITVVTFPAIFSFVANPCCFADQILGENLMFE